MQKLTSWLGLSKWDYLAIAICSVPAFYLLGTAPIYIWDEAVYANASLDIARGGSWWIPTDEMYNTKPPLVLWFQALFLKIIPSAEWAIRLPSALSVTGILLMMTLALKRWDFDQWTRILAMVAFVGNEGFIRLHIARTGDLDAVMTFFVTGYCFIILDAIHADRWTRKHFGIFCLFVIGAFYAKSIGGWIMLGPLSIVWLLSPLRRVLGTFSFWLGALFSAVICLLYYFLRESYQPGYIAITWFSEYLRMFENVMPWHEHPFSFYFKNFHQLKFYTPWIFALLLSIGFILLLLKRNISQQHALRWTILSLGYLLIISLPAVKLEWYDSPVYPFFALILGVTAGYFTQKLPVSLRLILLLPIAFILFRKMSFISHNTLPREPLEYEGYMLRESKSNNAIKVFMPVETSEHRLQLDFYKKLREMETGQSIEVLDSTSQIETGDELVINHPHLSGVNQQFEVDTLQYWEKYGALIKVAGKK